MTMRFNSILESLEAYVPGEQPRDGQYIKLNTNECPYPPAPSVVESIMGCLGEGTLNKYPDPVSLELRKAIAQRLDVSPDCVLVGNGSDEVLRLICHALLWPGESIAMLYPTYVLYRTLAAMFGARCIEVDVQPPDYAIPEKAFSTASQIFFLANPNPPIGTLYPNEVVEELVKAQPERLVVVDEAYADFAKCTALQILQRYPNIAITRTFSKCYALAGLRVGFVIARPALIAQLAKLKDSYNVNRISQAAALAAWEASNYYAKIVTRICATREYLTAELRKRQFVVPSSAGNFVFARRPDAPQLYHALKERKILVRYFDARSLRDGIRITIGTEEEVAALLQAIDEFDRRA